MRHEARHSLKLLTTAVVLPVSLQEVRSHLDTPEADETKDVDLMGLIRACTETCERHTRRSFVTTTWTLWRDRFPGRKLPWWDGVRQMADTELTDLTESILMPRPPLIAITHVKAHKQDGTTTTVDSGDYIVDVASEPGRVALKVTKTWPTDALRAINGVEVEFTAGYGPVGSDVPAPIRQAILICVGHAHSNPEGSAVKREKVGESEVEEFSPVEIPIQAQNFLSTYKMWRL